MNTPSSNPSVTRIAQHFMQPIPGEPESYVYKFYTKRGFWSLVAARGSVSIVDHDEDEGGEFCVVMFHDAGIAAEFGIEMAAEAKQEALF